MQKIPTSKFYRLHYNTSVVTYNIIFKQFKNQHCCSIHNVIHSINNQPIMMIIYEGFFVIAAAGDAL
jgi:hypothetical protein